MVRTSFCSSCSQGTRAYSYILSKDWQLPDKLLENFLEKKTHECHHNWSSQQCSCFSVLTQKQNRHLSVHKPSLALGELLISLFSTFVLSVSEQPKSIRHIRKAADVQQRHQVKKIKEVPGKKPCPSRLDSRMNYLDQNDSSQTTDAGAKKRKKRKEEEVLIIVSHWRFLGLSDTQQKLTDTIHKQEDAMTTE